MSFKKCARTAVALLLMLSTVLALPVNAESTEIVETLPAPTNVIAKRYSLTAAEIFWALPATFGLRYEISRDGTFLKTIEGISYFDNTLAAEDAPTYSIIAIDRQGNRSPPATIMVPLHNAIQLTLPAPTNVVAKRYSVTAAEIFWALPTTFGLRYEISRDGTFLKTIEGISYFDNTLAAEDAPTYSIIAIDRQGNRSSPATITVPIHGDVNPDPDGLLITLDSYEQILRELILLINGIPLDDTLNSQPDISDEGITFVSVSPEPIDDEVLGFGFVYDYVCNAGGTIERFYNSSGASRFTYTDCALETGLFDGELRDFLIGREGTGVTATDFRIDTGDRSRSLSGTHGASGFRGDPGRNRYWRTTVFDDQSSEGTLTLRNYELDVTSRYYTPDAVNNSDLLVSFEVTAPWTGQQPVQVDATLQTALVPDTAFTWQSGEVTVVAGDGSQLTLTPADVAQRTFDVTVSGIDAAITRQWSDGFEIYCAFTDIDECGSSF